jgi:hypothetical protein
MTLAGGRLHAGWLVLLASFASVYATTPGAAVGPLAQLQSADAAYVIFLGLTVGSALLGAVSLARQVPRFA